MDTKSSYFEKSILLNTRTLYFSRCRNRPHWSRVPPFGSTTTYEEWA